MVGQKYNMQIPDLCIGGLPIKWTTTLKYLGIIFEAGHNLHVDTSAIRRKFYATCNSILYKCKNAHENVKLHLVHTYCLPILMYCLGALKLSAAEIEQIGVCWNDAFRKIYGLRF